MVFRSNSGEVFLSSSFDLVTADTLSPKERLFQVSWGRQVRFEGYLI
jgi:hypothetical protein